MPRLTLPKTTAAVTRILFTTVLSLFLLYSFTALPANAVKKNVSWELAKQGCAADKRNVLTVKSLLDLAAGKGEHTPESLRLPKDWYWSSDAASEPGKYLAVSLPEGKVEAHTASQEFRFICDPGPRRSAARTWEEADVICTAQGKRLPTTAYLQSISGETGDASYAAKGLSMGNYWTRDIGEQGHNVVLTGNGKHSWFPDTDKFSVYCTDN